MIKECTLGCAAEKIATTLLHETLQIISSYPYVIILLLLAILAAIVIVVLILLYLTAKWFTKNLPHGLSLSH